MSQSLPIWEIQQAFLNHWRDRGAIVGAPPGSGKTTQLPLWVMQEAESPVYLLIPKRLAVKLAAKQLSQNLESPVGKEIGYLLRNESKTSKQTKLFVTTYGSFLRLLLNDPDRITGATIIFDEFHERSTEQDLCYALINQYATLFDDSLKRVFMSATLNVEKIARQTELPIVESKGFTYPVNIEYKPIDVRNPMQTSQLVRTLYGQLNHHLLVFCAGYKEIRQLERQLQDLPVLVLHSRLENTPDLQGLNIAEPTIILSTNIAESSVTLANVHTVVDLGQERFAQTHPVTGITELKTRKISKASATQRAGRAGRLGPGRAIRLWSEGEQESRINHQPPEILTADLTDVLLQVSHWGSSPNDLDWLDKPSEQRWTIAQEKLRNWQAISQSNALTEHGKTMQQSGLQSWLAHLLSLAAAENNLEAACFFAAHLLRGEAIEYDPFSISDRHNFSKAIQTEASLLAKRFGESISNSFNPMGEQTFVKAFSDRLIKSANGEKDQLISGTSVQNQSRQQFEWAVLIDGVRQSGNVIATSVVPVNEETVFDAIPIVVTTEFSPNQKPQFTQTKRLGKICLATEPSNPDENEKKAAWLNYIDQYGESAFSWPEQANALRRRWQLASALDKNWPNWLAREAWQKYAEPFLAGLKQFSDIKVLPIIEHALGDEHLQELNQLFPCEWTAPSGRRIPIEYQASQLKASVSLKLQECFGLTTQPTLSYNLPLQLDMLAPNGRPLASVTDLSHFWNSVYPEVRKEMRGRYAKHPWPEDPVHAEATQKTNRQLKAEQ